MRIMPWIAALGTGLGWATCRPDGWQAWACCLLVLVGAANLYLEWSLWEESRRPTVQREGDYHGH